MNHAPKAGHATSAFRTATRATRPIPSSGRKRSCAEFTPPAFKQGGHVAPDGLKFYTGKMFPAEYRNRIFIAQHGSWNRSKKSGYRVIMVTLKDNTVTDARCSQRAGWRTSGTGAGRWTCW